MPLTHVSPGLIQLHREFGWAYKQKGLCLRGLVNELQKRRSKHVFHLLVLN